MTLETANIFWSSPNSLKFIDLLIRKNNGSKHSLSLAMIRVHLRLYFLQRFRYWGYEWNRPSPQCSDDFCTEFRYNKLMYLILIDSCDSLKIVISNKFKIKIRSRKILTYRRKYSKLSNDFLVLYFSFNEA